MEEKDLEAQIKEDTGSALGTPVDTPSLCADSSAADMDSPPLPGAWIDTDNLMETRLPDLEAFGSDSAYSEDETDLVDVVDSYYSQSPSMLSVESACQPIGLGLNIDIPVITFVDCESRPAPPEDVNFPEDSPAPRSPVIVHDSPEVEFLAAPPAQFCSKDRQAAEDDALYHSRVHRMSVVGMVAALRVVKKVKGARPVVTGLDERDFFQSIPVFSRSLPKPKDDFYGYF